MKYHPIRAEGVNFASYCGEMKRKSVIKFRRVLNVVVKFISLDIEPRS